MCGRYVRRGQKQELAERTRAGVVDPQIPDLIEHYNIAPTTFQPVVRHTLEGGTRELLLMRRSLVPFFAHNPQSMGYKTFNAKAEMLENSAMWREPFRPGVLLGNEPLYLCARWLLDRAEQLRHEKLGLSLNSSAS